MARPRPMPELRGMKYLRGVLPLLERLHDSGCERDRAHNRTLFFDQYAALMLAGLFTPMIASMRDVCRISDVKTVRRKLGVRRVSAGSFSEASHVFDPDLLLGVIDELSPRLRTVASDARLEDLKLSLTLVDGTLLRALPKMAEAMYAVGRDGGMHHGWKLHTQLDFNTFTPRRIDITAPSVSEAGTLKQALKPGRCYVMDRGYGVYGLFDAIGAIGGSYVCRIRDDCVRTPIEARPLTPEAIQAGVVSDTLVELGGAKRVGHPVRIVEVKSNPRPPRGRTRGYNAGHCSRNTLLIGTDLLDVPAEVIGLIYQRRWTIEIFFRFFKGLLGCRHLYSEHPNGIAIEIYLAVIACMLLNLWTGRKINKAMWQMFAWHFCGLASLAEVEAFLNKPDNTGIKKRAEAELWKKLGVIVNR